ncbi:MAG: MotA/TolQ/ExbB proton channel family protein, partial [Bdellovibrionales bacterium]|nr:MotA/TolQ/ExbB proton channel family protein [Bdellovibrionales bacterium]
GVVYYGAILVLPSQEVVFNTTSMVLVIGGTFSAFLISFPIHRAVRIKNLVVNNIFKRKKDKTQKVVTEVVRMAQVLYKGKDISQLGYSHFFLHEGAVLLSDQGLDHDDFEYVIRQRARMFKTENHKDYQFLIALAKFPPAFGLLGSVTGIIAMLMNLGSAGKEIIGQGMAIALLTTFWGVAVTNMFILPLADFAQRSNKEDEELRQIIVEGLVMVCYNEMPSKFARKLRSLVTLEDRMALSSLQEDLNDSEAAQERLVEMRKHG